MEEGRKKTLKDYSENLEDPRVKRSKRRSRLEPTSGERLRPPLLRTTTRYLTNRRQVSITLQRSRSSEASVQRRAGRITTQLILWSGFILCVVLEVLFCVVNLACLCPYLASPLFSYQAAPLFLLQFGGLFLADATIEM